jgi:hypothetical protein
MSLSPYLCHVVGETPERAARFHISTVRRTATFAIAIHIPVLLWAITGYVIASQIFHLGQLAAGCVSALCAALVYLVERIVLATPKTWFVNLMRVAIGLVMAVLGATTVDLVLFDREINAQLRQDGETRLLAEHDAAIQRQSVWVEQKKTEWLKAQDAANCEANGTCGSKVRSVGPIFKELARQAHTLRQDYLAAQQRHTQLLADKADALTQWRANPPTADQAGLLARVQALHAYTLSNTAAGVAWLLFFALVLFFELMVVIAKLVFGDTVDDELDRLRERLSHQKAQAYVEAITSPLAPARALLASV